MNTNDIESRLSAATGRASESLQGTYDAIQSNMDLTDAEREAKAVEANSAATDALFAATVENINALVDRHEELFEELFVADSTAFTTTQASVIGLDDEALALRASRAARSKNDTLARVVASEADARGLDDLAYAALRPWPEMGEAYSELKSIPSPELRARRIENVVNHGLPMPSLERVRPTPEQHRGRDAERARRIFGKHLA
jgi:hypothetical protein